MRHGGDQQRVDIEQIDIPIETRRRRAAAGDQRCPGQADVEHPQIAELVKLRCFVGLEIAEAARVLHIPGHRLSALAIRAHLALQELRSAETHRARISYSVTKTSNSTPVSADSISVTMAAVLPFSKVALCNGSTPQR